MIDYFYKYIKYKTKYLDLVKHKEGGGGDNNNNNNKNKNKNKKTKKPSEYKYQSDIISSYFNDLENINILEINSNIKNIKYNSKVFTNYDNILCSKKTLCTNNFTKHLNKNIKNNIKYNVILLINIFNSLELDASLKLLLKYLDDNGIILIDIDKNTNINNYLLNVASKTNDVIIKYYEKKKRDVYIIYNREAVFHKSKFNKPILPSDRWY